MKSQENPTFEIVLVTRAPDKKITVNGETRFIPGDPTGTKSCSSDSGDKICEFFERNRGVKKHKKKMKPVEEKTEDKATFGRTIAEQGKAA